MDPGPDGVVAGYGTEGGITAAVKQREDEKFDMSNISVVGKGRTE